jgi:hypothetical protein
MQRKGLFVGLKKGRALLKELARTADREDETRASRIVKTWPLSN